MNIFSLDEKEFDKKIDEIFDNIDPETLMKDLVSCGLKVEKKEEYSVSNTYFIEDECNYSIEVTKIGFWDKLFRKKEEVSNDLMEAA